MLSVQHLTVRFEGAEAPAVDDVCLDLDAGQVLAVLGPSGCGKSTLLRAVAGLEPLEAGSVTYAGRDLAGTPTHRRGFALMFQDGQLFPQQSVAGNVGYALRLRRRPAREVARRVEELLELVGLPGFGGRSTHGLSGGERQRVALARALAVEPRLLLLDEPLSALDRTLRERLAADLREILTVAGTTALFVTHDQEEAFAVADRMALMRTGSIVQHGTPEQVWHAPVDAEAARFLGYATVLEGAAAQVVLRAGGSPTATGPVALRRSALRAVPDRGQDAVPTRVSDADASLLRGRVLEERATPDLVRLAVEIAGVGRVDAVADLPSAGASAPGVGSVVPLAVDLTRAALLEAPGASRSTP